MEEIWKDVQGFEGYYVVSNLGNVRALDRYVLHSSGVVQPRAGHIMTQTLNSDGYPTVKLSKDGKSIRIAVHRLVAIAFVPNPDGLAEVIILISTGRTRGRKILNGLVTKRMCIIQLGLEDIFVIQI